MLSKKLLPLVGRLLASAQFTCIFNGQSDKSDFWLGMHGWMDRMQTGSSDENSVCPSVHLSFRPSVKHVICDKTKKRSVQICIPYERSLSLIFWEGEWLVGATPSTWNSGSTGPRWSEIVEFQSIFARSALVVAPRKNVQLTLIGNRQRAFQWA